ncbi:hypothetical protein [Micromonospora sp. NPDC005291]|uniref:WD40 repeat domain-containing protein n=1 Tax=Micromonospora sp. NPDC005291 TaxID=3156872 RepID=UPI0033AED925
MDAPEQISETPGRFENPAGGGGGHTDAVRDVTAGRWEGRTVFASGSDDRTVRLWEAATGQPLGHALTGHAGRVRYAAFTGPHRDILVTVDDSGVVLRWRSDAGAPRSEPFARLESRIVGLGVANVDGRALVSVGTEDGAVRIFDAVTGEHHAEVRVDAGWELNRADIGVLDGRLVALTIARDPAVYRPSLATLTMWDVASGRPLYEPSGVPEETEGLGTFATLDGQLVAIRGIDPYHDFGDGVDVDDEQKLDRSEHEFAEEDEDDYDEDGDDGNPYQSEYFLDETDDFWVIDVATRKVLKEYSSPRPGRAWRPLPVPGADSWRWCRHSRSSTSSTLVSGPSLRASTSSSIPGTVKMSVAWRRPRWTDARSWPPVTVRAICVSGAWTPQNGRHTRVGACPSRTPDFPGCGAPAVGVTACRGPAAPHAAAAVHRANRNRG